MPTADPTDIQSREGISKRDAERGYREGTWGGRVNYECVDDRCWMGTYSRAATSDEADMQQHQREKHGR